MKTGSNKRYIGRVVGLVDKKTVEKAKAVGIENIAGGSINKKDKRVRIFVKGLYPGAHPSGGYALRSRVVWWLNTGEVLHGLEKNIHHKNHVRSDDRFSNLEKIGHHDHTRLHNPKTVEMVERTCIHCLHFFTIERWRLKDESRGRFCSQKCYQAHPKSKESRQKQGISLRAKYAEGWRPR
jgi:hypothetical protein